MSLDQRNEKSKIKNVVNPDEEREVIHPAPTPQCNYARVLMEIRATRKAWVVVALLSVLMMIVKKNCITTLYHH
jgi:hypothetical protein